MDGGGNRFVFATILDWKQQRNATLYKDFEEEVPEAIH